MNKKMNVKNVFDSIYQELKTKLNRASFINHPTSKGDATENIWIEWLNNNLPKRYIAEKGFVIDCHGNISDQIDIIIHDNFYAPLVFNINGEKYIPAESVFAVFEVKQTINSEFVTYASEKIRSVRKLERTSATIKSAIKYIKIKPPYIIGGILSSRADWTKDNYRDDLILNVKKNSDLDDKKDISGNIDIVCSVENPTYYICYNDEIQLLTDEGINSLLYFYLKLLTLLQNIGNPPAIEYEKYGFENVDFKEEDI